MRRIESNRMKREFRLFGIGHSTSILTIKPHRQYTYKINRNSLEYFNLHLSGTSGDDVFYAKYEFVIRSLAESITPLTTLNEIIMVDSKNLSVDISYENRRITITGINKENTTTYWNGYLEIIKQ